MRSSFVAKIFFLFSKLSNRNHTVCLIRFGNKETGKILAKNRFLSK